MKRFNENKIIKNILENSKLKTDSKYPANLDIIKGIGDDAAYWKDYKFAYCTSTDSLVENVQLFSHVANIGDTRSLIIHPASTTHSQLSDDEKIRAGAGPDVVRLSIGLESVEDIIEDLDNTLS